MGGLLWELGAPLLILVMLVAATVAGFQARARGHGWDELQRCCGEKLAAVLPAILILLAIGMLIGTWVLSGTIPLLVYHGLRLVDPEHIVLTAFLATAAMSLVTGTSWGSAGTLGAAFLGMAGAVEAPLASTAGAVISGAYFGDKMSPLSDSTNICAIGAGADLYAHIRNMLFTAVPSFLLAAVVYASVGAVPELGGELPASARDLLAQIDLAFGTAWPALLPPLVVLVGVARRLPPAPTMALSSLVAMAAGVFGHGFLPLDALRAAVDGFDPAMVASLGLAPESFGAEFGRLTARGGINSMAPILPIIVAAFLFAAGLDLSGALDTLLRHLLAGVRGTFGLVAATLAAGTVMVSLTSHGGVTALIVGGLFQKAYREQKLASENLARSLEDSVTLLDPLLPWTVSGLFMSATLGVPTLDYLPWAVFCWGGFFFSLLWAALYRRTGWGMRPLAAEGG